MTTEEDLDNEIGADKILYAYFSSTTLIPASSVPAGKRVRVHAMSFGNSVVENVTVATSGGGTHWGSPNANTLPNILNWNPRGWFETDVAGAALIGTGTSLGGCVCYSLIDA